MENNSKKKINTIMVSINRMNKYTRMHANPIISQFNNTPYRLYTKISMTIDLAMFLD